MRPDHSCHISPSLVYFVTHVAKKHNVIWAQHLTACKSDYEAWVRSKNAVMRLPSPPPGPHMPALMSSVAPKRKESYSTPQAANSNAENNTAEKRRLVSVGAPTEIPTTLASPAPRRPSLHAHRTADQSVGAIPAVIDPRPLGSGFDQLQRFNNRPTFATVAAVVHRFRQITKRRSLSQHAQAGLSAPPPGYVRARPTTLQTARNAWPSP